MENYLNIFDKDGNILATFPLTDTDKVYIVIPSGKEYYIKSTWNSIFIESPTKNNVSIIDEKRVNILNVLESPQP